MDAQFIKWLQEKVGIPEVELEEATKTEMFEQILEYEGIIGYQHWILEVIRQIWEINLKEEQNES